MTPVPKAEPKGKAASVPESKTAEGQKRERKSRWDPDEPVKESTKREASKRPDDVDNRPGAAAREASGDDLHSALGRSSVKDAVAPLTASKAMAAIGRASCCEPGGGSFPGVAGEYAFLTMSPDRVLNRQVRDFIRNGENASALEVLNQIVANSRLVRTRRDSDVSRTPSWRSVRTLDTRDSRESRRRRY